MTQPSSSLLIIISVVKLGKKDFASNVQLVTFSTKTASVAQSTLIVNSSTEIKESAINAIPDIKSVAMAHVSFHL